MTKIIEDEIIKRTVNYIRSKSGMVVPNDVYLFIINETRKEALAEKGLIKIEDEIDFLISLLNYDKITTKMCEERIKKLKGLLEGENGRKK